MASKDRIDSIIDRDAIRDEVQATKKDIHGLVELIKSVKGTAVKVSGAKSISEYNELKKQLDVLIKQTELSAKASINDAKAREINAKAALAEAKAVTESAKSKRIETQATEASTKAKANESKLLDQAIDDYYQLSKAYDEAARRAQNYVLRLGETHPIAVQAVKDANDMANVLKHVDSVVGKHQRNVGNYKSAFDGLGFSFAQIGRELPSLSVSVQQFALAISNNLPIAADELRKAREEIKAMKAAGEQTPSLFSRIAKSIFSFQTALSVGITLVTLFASRLFGANSETKKAIEANQKLTGVYNDQNTAIKNLVESLGSLSNARLKELLGTKDKLEAAGKSTIDIEKQIADQRVKIAQQNIGTFLAVQRGRIQSVEEEKNIGASILQLQKIQQDALSKYDVATQIEINRRREYLSKKKKYLLEEAELEKEKAAQAKNTYDTVTGLLNALTTAETDKATLDARLAKEAADRAEEEAKRSKEAADLRLKVLTEIKALELQRIIDFNNEIADNDKNGEFARLAALRKAKEAEIELTILTHETEKQLGEKTALEIELIEKQKLDKIYRLEKEFVSKRISIQEEVAAKRKKIEEDLQKDLEKIIKAGYDAFKKKDDERLKQTQDVAKQRLDILADFAAQERDLYKGLYDELTGIITDFFTAQDEARIKDLEDEGAVIDERTKREIDFINQTVTNRQEAAARISIVEAQALADKQELENKKREIERNSANIERLSKLAEIAGNTASTIFDLEAKAASARATAALLASNPATAAFAPNALLQASLISGQIPFVLAKAALQLVRLAIPRFAEGGLHEGGLMMVGDGGRAEGIQLPDGTVLKSPSTPTVMEAPAGTIIHKDYQRMMFNSTMGAVPVFKSKATTDTSTPVLLGGLSRIEKAVKNIKQPTIQVENLISKKIRGVNYLNKY